MNLENNPLIDVILSKGYVKDGYGYKKVTEDNTHWITLFGKDSLQMYAYFSEDAEFSDVYNTQVLESVSPKELEVLIDVLIRSHA